MRFAVTLDGCDDRDARSGWPAKTNRPVDGRQQRHGGAPMASQVNFWAAKASWRKKNSDGIDGQGKNATALPWNLLLLRS